MTSKRPRADKTNNPRRVHGIRGRDLIDVFAAALDRWQPCSLWYRCALRCDSCHPHARAGEMGVPGPDRLLRPDRSSALACGLSHARRDRVPRRAPESCPSRTTVDRLDDTGRFALPPEQAIVFAEPESPVYMQGGFDLRAAHGRRPRRPRTGLCQFSNRSASVENGN